MKKNWNFMIDQGGTFTDIIALNPKKEVVFLKVLSNYRESNELSILEGIKILMKKNKDLEKFPINSIRIGTTIATNALLERKGEKVLHCVTKGFKDNFIIGDQKRDHLFKRHFLRKPNIYHRVLEIDERISKEGKIIKKIDKEKTNSYLKKYFDSGIRSISIVLVNSFKYPSHEKIIYNIAKKIGYKFISCSYLVSPTINYTARGYTTLIDAYLNPLIKEYTNNIFKNVPAKEIAFMQSNGFLCKKNIFNGKNAIYSGPAGGVNAGIKIAKDNNIRKIIGFDMGGTSSDIWHYYDGIEKKLETRISDIIIKTPTLKIDSIASGGGSIIKYEHQRLVVGPESAGSFPGPTCYRNNGPLTLTDCNLVLGKISDTNFPRYFGKNKNKKILKSLSFKKFEKLFINIRKDFPEYTNVYQIADAFIKVAVENMASAIKKISLQKGYDIRDHSLLIFGSASGQYCCQVADKLGIKKIIFHPLSSLLSAYGTGISDHGNIYQTSIEKEFNLKNLKISLNAFKNSIRKEEYTEKKFIIRLKYKGSNTVIQLRIADKDITKIKKSFHLEHKKQFGFNFLNRIIIIDSIELECFKKEKKNISSKKMIFSNNLSQEKKRFFNIYSEKKWSKVQNVTFSDLKKEKKVNGPAILNDFNTSILIEKDWSFKLLSSGGLEILKNKNQIKSIKISSYKKKPNPEILEIFNNLFFSTAEQMGEVLKNTSQSINIKERLDFSCALFDKEGNLIANAPHIPIHLGAMSETVKHCIKEYNYHLKKGTSLLHNDPYTGGTHLPDLTIITPYLNKKNKKVKFYLANRAHHSDIGGISPGSMPAFSKNINEEGIIFNGFPILENGKIKEEELIKKLKQAKYPSRDPYLNLSDIKAQVAATKKGIIEIERIINDYGLINVLNYVKFIQKNCTDIIKKVIEKLPKAKSIIHMDNGSFINLSIEYNKNIKKLIIDFKGSSNQLLNNFNTPIAVTKSVIIYFLRTLIKENIPLNEGCLKDVDIRIPSNCMLKPKFPSPVVAGNVETSQSIIDLLNGSIKVQAACYGTMNNITFGDKNFGYYETICGGEGASKNHKGTDAVHCHMTNTSITDAEILEWNYPVRLKSFSIRKNSGGKGKNNGGNGTIREIYFLKNLDVTILSNRRVIKPFGLNGGKPGKLGKNIIIKKDKKAKRLKHSCNLKVSNGDIIRIETPGGGGFGKP